MPPPRLSGDTFGMLNGRPSGSFLEMVPAPLYPDTPKTVGHAPTLRYFTSGAIRSCDDVAKHPGLAILFDARIAERP